jgi:hypothetical protein
MNEAVSDTSRQMHRSRRALIREDFMVNAALSTLKRRRRRRRKGAEDVKDELQSNPHVHTVGLLFGAFSW